MARRDSVSQRGQVLPKGFEERTTEHLRAQDEVLARVEKKLESPALNGGFESLLEKVTRIDTINETLRAGQVSQGQKIDEIHDGIYHPEKGLYAKVKSHSSWIKVANWVIKGTIGVVGAATVAGIGKLLYDIFQGHIHYVP